MALEYLLALNLFSQSTEPVTESVYEVPPVQVFAEDTTNKSKVEEKVRLPSQITPTNIPKKAEEEGFPVTGGLYFGNHGAFGFNGDFKTTIKLPSNIGKIVGMPYLDVRRDDAWENAGLGAIVSLEGKNFSVAPNLEMSKGNSQETDTLTRDWQNIITPIQDGQSVSSGTETQISNGEYKTSGFDKGIDLKLNTDKNDIAIQFGGEGKSRKDHIITVNDYLENLRDSTYISQGGIIILTDLDTRVLTNVVTDINTKDNIGKARIFYKHMLANGKLDLGLDASLKHHSLDTEIRQRTNITTDGNGRTRVRVGTDTNYVDINFHEEENRSTRNYDEEQINTDMIGLFLGINGNENVNNKLWGDLAYYSSPNRPREWSIKNQFNWQSGNVANSITAVVDNSKFGGKLFFGFDNLGLGFVKELSNAMYEKEQIERNAALNDRQKGILLRDNDYSLLTKLVGPFMEFGMERVGGSDDGFWKLGSRIGYMQANYAGIWAGYETQQSKKKIYVGGLKNDIKGNLFFEWDNYIPDDTRYKVGCGITFGK